MSDHIETHEIVAMFDIAGFTNIPAAFASSELVDVLGRYLDTIFRLIESSGGTPQHLNGTAVLGFWPADVSPSSKERIGRALANAVTQVSKIALPGNLSCVPIIGVASGAVLHASLAVAGREIPVSMGPIMNLAMRLSSGCSMMKKKILFPSALPVRWPATVRLEEVGPIVVKGMPEQLQLASLSDEQG